MSGNKSIKIDFTFQELFQTFRLILFKIKSNVIDDKMLGQVKISHPTKNISNIVGNSSYFNQFLGYLALKRNQA
jgi:hypothetical protein